MTRLARGLAVLGLALVLAGCGGDGDDDAADSTSTTVDAGVTTSSEAASTSSLVASTASTAATSTTEAGTTSESTSTTASSTTSTTAGSTTETTSGPTTTEILVIEGGVHAFTSPSGNIACVMSEQSASCWISEKNWTIDQPDGPDCDISDWGNAVEVTAGGASYPCYTDFGWNPSAPALAYGNAVELGPFFCASAESGVTCRHSSGASFSLARAAVQLT